MDGVATGNVLIYFNYIYTVYCLSLFGQYICADRKKILAIQFLAYREYREVIYNY